MEFLVKLEVNVPNGTEPSAVEERYAAEASASANMAEEGHFLRLWQIEGVAGRSTAIGLYRADTESQLDGLLRGMPLYDWMQVTVTPLGPHPHDPALTGAGYR